MGGILPRPTGKAMLQLISDRFAIKGVIVCCLRWSLWRRTKATPFEAVAEPTSLPDAARCPFKHIHKEPTLRVKNSSSIFSLQRILPSTGFFTDCPEFRRHWLDAFKDDAKNLM